MRETLGQVTSVSGSQITATLEADAVGENPVRVGTLVKAQSFGCDVVGAVGAVEAVDGAYGRTLLTIDLLGELAASAEGPPRFARGVSRHPAAGAPLLAMTEADLRAVYARSAADNIRIGTLYNDPERPALIAIDQLLGNHFAVLGTTGSGKSCAVILILSAILGDHPNAHIVVLDPHNEYATAFGELAEVVNVDNLDLPFWLFNFEEAVGILVRGGTATEQESQAIILKEAITRARRHFAGDDISALTITVDTPVPFRVSDLVRFLDEGMGKLDNPDTAVPYLRLKTRLDSLRTDRRFAFMFSDRLLTRDTMAEVVGRLLRIPVSGRPITIMDLSGVPSEIADVVVSLSCRVTFDFCLWARREQMPPVLLVCEEAHRYIPSDERIGFAATAREITRIAKEGRKYGVSLALVSQRPSELFPAVLSQCGTIFALRLGNSLDQRFVATALPDAAQTMLTVLSSMRIQEAIISGEGVSLPMRVRFDDLPADRLPRRENADFSQAWQIDSADARFLADGLRRWRQQTRTLPRAG